MQENKYNDSSFILNTVRQLKGGMKCYVFKRSQVDEVLASYYKNNTNEMKTKKGRRLLKGNILNGEYNYERKLQL